MALAAAHLEAGETLAAVEHALRRRREAEVDDLVLVLHYADLHRTIAPDVRPGGEALARLGGEGTPGVSDLAVVELGVARQVHTLAAQSVVADALDLRHRLPSTWRAVLSGDCEAWLARRISRLTRALSYEHCVHLVDPAIAAVIKGQSPARVLEIAEAKVIEADQEAHDARVEVARKRRFVGLSRIDAEGMRHVIARVTAGDAAGIDATVQRVADQLAERPEFVDHGADELRAEAFAWLARPEDVLALAGGAAEPRRRQTRSILYVHLSEAALVGLGGIARVESLGPHSLHQLTELLGHTQVILKPVIDLNDQVSVNSYEHPESIKERIHLTWVGDAFPHATRSTRTVDHDHIKEFDHSSTAPPGQTGPHTSQPLSRTAHRAKTHLRYRCRRLPGIGVLWTTPHGLHRLVDHTGTHPIDQAEHDAWLSSDSLERVLVQISHRHRIGEL